MEKLLLEREMPNLQKRILIVDDEESIRTSISLEFSEIGYSVRCAEDGFAALRQIRRQIPDILLSDLNMPGMSGFELLWVVRRRFPAIHAIAMSGAFSGDEVPSGVAADGFYQKSCSLDALLQIIGTMPRIERRLLQSSRTSAPLWMHRNQPEPSQGTRESIVCPECLRTSPQPVNGSGHILYETNCVHCGSPIQSEIVRLPDQSNPWAFQHSPGMTIPVENAVIESSRKETDPCARLRN
jgi:CheY-like chemotaxis protein